MTQASFIVILDKIRSISKESSNIELPPKDSQHLTTCCLDSYLKALEQIRLELIKYHSLEDEYLKLEELVQREEAELRQKIGIELQLRLQSDSLRAQLQELQLQKAELLQSSKIIIKNLKKTNEELFFQLHFKKQQQKDRFQQKKHKISEKSLVTDRARALSLKKTDSLKQTNEDTGFRDILKTEFISRDIKPNATLKLQKSTTKTINKGEGFLQKPVMNIKQNSRTYQVTETKTDREPLLISKKKKNKHITSNFSVFQSIKNHHKQQQQHLKSCYLPKSPQKKDNRIVKSRPKVNRALWKEKITNRSVASISSVELTSDRKQQM